MSADNLQQIATLAGVIISIMVSVGSAILNRRRTDVEMMALNAETALKLKNEIEEELTRVRAQYAQQLKKLEAKNQQNAAEMDIMRATIKEQSNTIHTLEARLTDSLAHIEKLQRIVDEQAEKIAQLVSSLQREKTRTKRMRRILDEHQIRLDTGELDSGDYDVPEF